MENIPYSFEVIAERDNKKISFDVQTMDLMGRADCRIGNFYLNFWYRTKKALNKSFEGYKNLKDYQKAVKLSLLKRGYQNITFTKYD